MVRDYTYYVERSIRPVNDNPHPFGSYVRVVALRHCSARGIKIDLVNTYNLYSGRKSAEEMPAAMQMGSS